MGAVKDPIMPSTAKDSLFEATTAEGLAKSEIQGSQPSDAIGAEVPVTIHASRYSAASKGAGKLPPVHEETRTVIIFPQGAVVRLSAMVTPGELVVVTNNRTGADVICRVTSVKTQPGIQNYVNLEFTQRALGFWEEPRQAERPLAKDKAPLGVVSSAAATAGANADNSGSQSEYAGSTAGIYRKGFGAVCRSEAGLHATPKGDFVGGCARRKVARRCSANPHCCASDFRDSVRAGHIHQPAAYRSVSCPTIGIVRLGGPLGSQGPGKQGPSNNRIVLILTCSNRAAGYWRRRRRPLPALEPGSCDHPAGFNRAGLNRNVRAGCDDAYAGSSNGRGCADRQRLRQVQLGRTRLEYFDLTGHHWAGKFDVCLNPRPPA